ncbi:hypothetical protein [Acidovorax sp. Q11]
MKFPMRNFLFFLIFSAKFISASASSGLCPVEVFAIERGNGLVEIGIKNNMKESFEISYDRLPWVLGARGANFEIAVDGQRIRTPFGAGHNTRIINIGPKSYISSIDDIGYLRSFYENIDKSRVTITWSYSIPGEKIPENCREVNGKISPP